MKQNLVDVYQAQIKNPFTLNLLEILIKFEFKDNFNNGSIKNYNHLEFSQFVIKMSRDLIIDK